MIAWMVLAMMVSTRLWLAGVVQGSRDRHLADALLQQVRRCAVCLCSLLVLTDGWSTYPNSIRRALRQKVKLTPGVGRACLQVWPELHMGPVIKRTQKKRVVEITRQMAHGLLEQAEKPLHSSRGGMVLNTAFIEGLNGTFRERLDSLMRQSRHATRRLKALEMGMYLIGCSYHFCFAHHELSKRSHMESACTPAMAAGLTDHVWSICELLRYQIAPSLWVPPKRRGRPTKQPGALPPLGNRPRVRLRKGGVMFGHRIVGFYHLLCKKEKSSMQPGRPLAHQFLPLIVGVIALLLAACGGNPSPGPSTLSGPSKASADKQIAVFPVSGVADLRTFDPALATDTTSQAAIDMVFTGLVQLDDTGAPYDELAASHSVAADGVTWTFTLRDHLTFSDGTPLTSADVAYSIDRALQPAEKSATSPIYLALVKDADKLKAGKLKTIIGESLLTPDPKTLVIVATKKAAYFLAALTYTCAFVVEKSLVDKWGQSFPDHLADGTGGGAGPWMVSKYVHGQEIDFVPNPHYYGPKPQLKKVIFPFYKVADTTYRAYQAGQLDSSAVPSAQLASAQVLPAGQFHQVPQLWIAYYAMNYLTKPFDNLKIRQAFALALDKDLIAHNIYKDTVIATNHIVPQGMPGYNPALTAPANVQGRRGDAALAKKLLQEGLQEAGYANAAALPAITLTVSSSGSADSRNAYAAVQQMWQTTLGVGVKIDDIDFNHLLDKIDATTNNPKGLQMWNDDWIADYPDPQNWTTLQFDKGVPNNNTNYGQNHTSDAAQQQATQQLLEQADVNPASASRLKQYQQAEQQLVNDVAWLPMYQVTAIFVRKPCVAGGIDNVFGLPPPKDWGAVYISTATPCATTSSYQ